MKYALNRDIGSNKKGKIFVKNENRWSDEEGELFDINQWSLLHTWLALGWLDEVDGKWKPEESELMWSITEDLEVRQLWPTCNIGIKNIKVRNAFPTKEKAEEARDAIKKLLAELK